MLALRLDEDLEKKLEKLAKETKRSKSYHAKEAIKKYIEDRADYLKALAALEDNSPNISLKEMKAFIDRLED